MLTAFALTLLNIIMSSKKIVRLKTPSRCPPNFRRSPESKTLSMSEQLDDLTVMKSCRNDQAEQVHAALISQLNKLYRQIQHQREHHIRQAQIRESLFQENKLLKSRLQVLERECHLEKERYQLERENHQRLRYFYEQRERQWVNIVIEHRRLLEQYDANNDKRRSKEDIELLSPANSRSTDFKTRGFPFVSEEAKEKYPILAVSDGYGQLNQVQKGKNSNQKGFSDIMQRIYEDQTRFIKKGSHQQGHSEESQDKEQKPVSHNETMEELFELTVRQTYLKFKEQGLTLKQIEQCDDMLKLKKAKSSTKERLTKTIKKLNFQFQGEKQMKLFCDYVQEQMLNRHKEFKGELIYQFFLDKLYECQKLHGSSNSVIDKLFFQSGNISDICKSPSRQPNQNNGKKPEGTLIQRLSQSNLELLLNSTVKDRQIQQIRKIETQEEKMKESEVSEVRYSVSQLRNLSELIRESRGGYVFE